MTLQGNYPKQTPEQADALSAACVVMALSSIEGTTVTPDMVCQWFAVTPRRMQNALKRLFRQLQRSMEKE